MATFSTSTAYTPQGTYSDAGLSEAEKAQIKTLSDQWKAATVGQNAAAADKAHNDAQAIRAQYGYSGGADGSAYIPLQTNTPNPATPAEPAPPAQYPVLPTNTYQPTPLPYIPAAPPEYTPLPNAPVTPPQYTPVLYSTQTTPTETPTAQTSNYTSQGTYNDAELSETDKAKMESLRYQWNAAMASGDVETANKLHEYAETIRAPYGYSGGPDGSSYIPLAEQQPGGTTGQAGGGYYTPPQLPTAQSAEQYLKDYYSAQQEAIFQAYKTAYDANMNELGAAAAKIPAQYQAARNQTAAQSEIQRANFNEYAAASGLNSGAGGQAMLAMGNQLQGDMSGISMAEADTLSDLELQRTQLATQYQNNIAQAIADGKLEEANALYGEFIRIDNSIVETAIAQANINANAYGMNSDKYSTNKADALNFANYTGDFSGMVAYGWSQQRIAAARQQWLDDRKV